MEKVCENLTGPLQSVSQRTRAGRISAANRRYQQLSGEEGPITQLEDREVGGCATRTRLRQEGAVLRHPRLSGATQNVSRGALIPDGDGKPVERDLVTVLGLNAAPMSSDFGGVSSQTYLLTPRCSRQTSCVFRGLGVILPKGRTRRR